MASDESGDGGSAGLIGAAEAARRLGVSRATLYAYVSRGLIRSAAKPGDPRASLYPAADIAALAERRDRHRRPTRAAATALDWGLPVLETRITRIEDGRLFYRVEDAVALAETASHEHVARLLWQADAADPFADARFDAAAVRGWSRTAAMVAALPATDRALTLLPLLLVDDRAAPDPFSGAAHLVRAMASACAGANLDPRLPLHRALAKAWRRPRAAEAIRRALVLAADHELNVSTFAVRVVASSGASLTAALLAGLAALSGPRHGGMTARVTAFLAEAERIGDGAAAVRGRLRRGEYVPGFGHRLYPDGDPRARALMPHTGDAALPLHIAASMERQTGLRPNLDFALAALESGHRLPAGAALALFAIGRAVGWIAHAFEQRAAGGLIRPRARFVSEPVGDQGSRTA